MNIITKKGGESMEKKTTKMIGKIFGQMANSMSPKGLETNKCSTKVWAYEPKLPTAVYEQLKKD